MGEEPRRRPVEEDVDEALGYLRESIIANAAVQISMMTRRSPIAEVILELELRLLWMSNEGDMPAVREVIAMMVTALKTAALPPQRM